MSGRAAAIAATLCCLLAPACSRCGGERGRPDVVLVSIDTLRADRIGAYGYGKAATPRLDSFAKEGVLFAAHRAQAPATLPSHASLFTGLDPERHGIFANGLFALGGEATTLAELLAAAGHRAGAFVAANVLAPLHGLDQGFSRYVAPAGAGDAEPRIPAQKVTDRAIAWLDERRHDERVFLFVHYFDPHKPYEAPARFDPADPYDAEVAYVDEQLARLFGALARSGRYEDALVVVTADHGQSLGEHGVEGHTGILYEQTLRIPLLVRFPGGRDGGRRVGAATRSVDVLPTVLAAAGVAIPAGIDGADLSRLARGGREERQRESFAVARIDPLPRLDQVAVVSGRWKLIAKTVFRPEEDLPFGDVPISLPQWLASRTGAPRLVERMQRRYRELAAGSPDVRQLFDLESDPAEKVNLYGARPEIARELEAKLEGRGVTKPGAPGRPAALDAQLAERLNALGYLY